MPDESPRVEPRVLCRRLLVGLLLASCAACVRSGHREHYIWIEAQQRSTATTRAFVVRPDGTATLTTYGRKQPDGSREVGPAFDERLTAAEMQELRRLLQGPSTAVYRADSMAEERWRSEESVFSVSVDAQGDDAPSRESLVLLFTAGQGFAPETSALVSYLIVLEQRIYDRVAPTPGSGSRSDWARPTALE